MALLAVLKSGVDAVLKPVDTFLGFVDIHCVARAILHRAVAVALSARAASAALRVGGGPSCSAPLLSCAPRVRVEQALEPALVGTLKRRGFEQLAADAWLQERPRAFSV